MHGERKEKAKEHNLENTERTDRLLSCPSECVDLSHFQGSKPSYASCPLRSHRGCKDRAEPGLGCGAWESGMETLAWPCSTMCKAHDLTPWEFSFPTWNQGRMTPSTT